MLKLFNFALCVVVLSKTVQGAETHSNTNKGLPVLHIAENDIIYAPQIYLHESLYLNNRGVIVGDIYICDGCVAYIRNSGSIHGELILGENAEQVHVIRTNDDITPITTNDPYSVLVYNAQSLTWGDIIAVEFAADKITIRDSVLDIAPTAPMMRAVAQHTVIELVGENEIHMNYKDITHGMLLMSNVSGTGTVRVQIDNMNPLYAATTSLDGGKLYLNLVREGDYYKILNNNVGRFLNSLRADNPNDKLIAKLDSATNIDQLTRIMHRSMRMNPRRMTGPIKTFMHHMRNMTSGGTATDGGSFAANPFVIFGRDISGHGFNAAILMPLNHDTTVAMGATAGAIKFTDGIDDMSANIYTADISAKYAGDKIFADIQTGLGRAVFDTPAIFHAGKSLRDTDMNVSYAHINIGPKVIITDAACLKPAMGLHAEYYDTAFGSEFAAPATIGAAFEFTREGVDLKYDYKLQISYDTTREIMAAYETGLFSNDDEIGGNLSFGILKGDRGTSYRVSMEIKLLF